MAERLQSHKEIEHSNAQRWINALLDYLDGDDTAFDQFPEPEYPHGKLVERRWEAYHDVDVYEDGYEERHYIGD